MPYRINPENEKQVQVKKEDEWILLKEHLSANQASRHLKALNMNVTEAK
jgi:hypothetical protein